VDDPNQMRVLCERGVDGIFTNHPDRLCALLGTLD
jgi:glycerophosphoryl diester phosphodiesterase